MSKPSHIHAASASTLRQFALRFALILLASSLTPEPLVKLTAFSIALAMFCATMATLRWETVMGPSLNGWDEASYYLLVSHAAVLLERG